jgi:predicted membrane chloride channel (bestrophin family)
MSRVDPPPLPLTLHLSHLVIIYLAALPCSLLCLVRGPYLILISLVAGWCLLGLEALITEVGGVFGESGKRTPHDRVSASADHKYVL